MNESTEPISGNSAKEDLERMIGEIVELRDAEPSFDFKWHATALLKSLEESSKTSSMHNLANALLFVVQGKIPDDEAEKFLERLREFRVITIDPYQSLSNYSERINQPPSDKTVPYHFVLSEHAQWSQEVITIRKCLAETGDVTLFEEEEYKTLLQGLQRKMVSVANHYGDHLEEIVADSRAQKRMQRLNGLMGLLSDLRNKANITVADIPRIQEQRDRIRQLLLQNIETAFQEYRKHCSSDSGREKIDYEKDEVKKNLESIFSE